MSIALMPADRAFTDVPDADVLVKATPCLAVDPTFTTSNATLITNTSARLNGTISGLDCEQADDTFWEWGLLSGNYTVNHTDTTNRGNGAVYYDLESLNSSATYYYRGAARLNGGAWQYGSELSFTTVSAFTLTAMTDSHIQAEWDAVDNVTGYLILISNIDYPDDPEGEYAVVYSGNETAVFLAGFNLDFSKYYCSLWSYTDNLTYSDGYSVASIGGDNMADLVSTMSTWSVDMNSLLNELASNAVLIIIVIFLMTLAAWRRLPIYYVIAGFAWIYFGFAIFTTAWHISLLLVLVGIVCFAGAKWDKGKADA